MEGYKEIAELELDFTTLGGPAILLRETEEEKEAS